MIFFIIISSFFLHFSSNIFLRIESSPGQGKSVPYCPITVKSTREIVAFNGLAEALLRLDFLGAVSDIRRFHYVSQLMYLLFAHDKLSQLPGAAQKILFRMLEEMANTVFKSNANEHVFRKLMDELQTTMTIYRVWGSHLGSSQLFKQHLESRRRITEFVEKMQVHYIIFTFFESICVTSFGEIGPKTVREPSLQQHKKNMLTFRRCEAPVRFPVGMLRKIVHLYQQLLTSIRGQ